MTSFQIVQEKSDRLTVLKTGQRGAPFFDGFIHFSSVVQDLTAGHGFPRAGTFFGRFFETSILFLTDHIRLLAHLGGGAAERLAERIGSRADVTSR